MANALTPGLIAAALSLAASAALADGAPAAYYPSLGYGQAPPPRQAQREPRHDDWRRHPARHTELRLPASFFTDSGGVGPAWVGSSDPRWRVYARPAGWRR